MTYAVYIDGRIIGTVTAPNLRDADRVAKITYGNIARAKIS